MVVIPYGMTLGEGLRVVGDFTEEELAEPKMQEIVPHCAEIWTLMH